MQQLIHLSQLEEIYRQIIKYVPNIFYIAKYQTFSDFVTFCPIKGSVFYNNAKMVKAIIEKKKTLKLAIFLITKF